MLFLRQVGEGSVVFEVTPDQVPGRQGRHQTELPRQDGAADHAGQPGSVLSCKRKEGDIILRVLAVTRVDGVWPLHTQHLQAGGLGRQYRPSSHGPHLRQSVSVRSGLRSLTSMEGMEQVM